MIPGQTYTTPDGLCKLAAVDYEESNYGRELLVVKVMVIGTDVTDDLSEGWNRIPLNLEFQFCGEHPVVFIPFEHQFLLFEYRNNEMTVVDYTPNHSNRFVQNQFYNNYFILVTQRNLFVRNLKTNDQFKLASKADEIFEEIVSVSDTLVVLRKSLIEMNGNQVVKIRELRETVDLRKEMGGSQRI